MRLLLFFALLSPIAFLGAQNESFKLMTYNLMYYKDVSAPCSQSLSFSEKDQAFKTVFKAVNPDILCVQELAGFPDNSGASSILSNVINTDGEVNFTSAEYTNNSFSSITNMIFFDSTRFGLHSQTYLSNQLNNQSLVRVIDFYRLYYKDPALKLGADTTFFTVVVGHLKAGNSAADRNTRENAAEAVMNYLTNEVADENVILTGDLNTYGSTEGAYQQFTNYSVSSKRFIDPGVPGAWNNNSTFAPIHTQSTHASGSGCYAGGGLDDRFDFIMHSQAIQTGSDNISYLFNSLEVIGNDGNHFNQSINSGTNSAVSAMVADALYDFSDHLPVIAGYEIELSDISLRDYAIENYIKCINPFDNQLVLRKDEAAGALSLSVLNITGKRICEAKMPSQQTELTLNTTAWKPGIYFIQIKDAEGHTFTKKLIRESDGVF